MTEISIIDRLEKLMHDLRLEYQEYIELREIRYDVERMQAENAALRERLEKAATFALDMCSEDDCAGDSSVGLPPCDMWHAWDTDGNGVSIESGCYLREYLTELKDRGQIK